METVNRLTGGKEPASSTAVLIDSGAGVLAVWPKSLQVDIEYLLIQQNGLSRRKGGDRVDL